tara:strand:- start:3527 stop:4303 length:777 start_codon:yes stop_codon:yes gene_type:complete
MYYEIHGLAAADAPVLVLSSGLGGSANFWQSQLPALTKKYCVLIYDHSGTGRSPAELAHDYSIASMASELIALLDELHIAQCHIIGHALGGLVALHIAASSPERVISMVLVNAWSSPNPHTTRCFNIRLAILDNCSHSVYLQTQALILYPPDWIVGNIQTLEKEEQHLLANFPDKTNLLARINALSQFNIDDKLASLTVNTLVIANKDDILVPWQRSQWLADSLPHATLVLFDYGGHACSVTTPTDFNNTLLKHLETF